MEKDLRFAVLIDAENFSSKYVKQLFDELSEDGHASIRRVYGGWEAPQLKPWKAVLETYSISTRQECCYSVGKSSSDSAMIIDAMDILYGGTVDGFCIASSDGDFTNLARRIREAGMTILGAGEKQTPKAFVNSCNRFIYVDLLDAEVAPKEESTSAPPQSEKATPATKTTKKTTKPQEKVQEKPQEETGPTSMKVIKKALVRYFTTQISKGNDGRLHLGAIGSHLRKLYPEFDCRNYHCRSLTELFKTLPEFEVIEQPSENGGRSKEVYVVCKAPVS